MLVLALQFGATTTLTHVETGEQIKLCLTRGGDEPRIGIEASKKWEIVRSNAKKRKQKIQADESDVADLGQRVIDPLGVADAYADADVFPVVE